MSCAAPILGILSDPGLLVTLIPLGVIVLGIVSFEVAMAVTISTLPRSRFQQKWTLAEQRRVLRVFGVIFSIWPTAATVILSHLFMPGWVALMCDMAALVIVALCVRWVRRGIKQRRLIMSGHCANCFYDLRASKESDYCPECGVELRSHPARQPRGRNKNPVNTHA